MSLIIGSHVSYKKDTQLYGSVLETISYEANAFMLYSGAPQNTIRSNINDELTIKANDLMKKNNIDKNNIIIHAPYIINLANNIDEDKYLFAIEFLKEEIKRARQLGIMKIVLHPGSYVSLTKEIGIKNIINALNEVLLNNDDVIICLETMAGKGSEIGSNFEELKEIIDNVSKSELLGVCMDTCHLNDAGYNLVDFDKILEEFDDKIGLEKLHCIHINDSYNDIGAKKDRHANIGFGTIGYDNLINIIFNAKLNKVIKILETPYVTQTPDSKKRLYAPYLEEIKMIKEKKFNSNLLKEIREKNN